MSVRRLLIAAAVLAVMPSLIGAQDMDAGTAMALLGSCAYREAVLAGQLQQTKKHDAELAEYWARWVGNPEEKK